jgi:hypothetical protein
VAGRILAATAGNPLGLIELGRELSEAELVGALPLPEPLPLGDRLQELFLRRIRSLPPDAQTLLLLASADPSEDAELLWRAAEQLGVDTDEAQILRVGRILRFGARVEFFHPLMRSAVYQGAPASERKRATRRWPPPATRDSTPIAEPGTWPQPRPEPTRRLPPSYSGAPTERGVGAAGLPVPPSSSGRRGSPRTRVGGRRGCSPPPRPGSWPETRAPP